MDILHRHCNEVNRQCQSTQRVQETINIQSPLGFYMQWHGLDTASANVRCIFAGPPQRNCWAWNGQVSDISLEYVCYGRKGMLYFVSPWPSWPYLHQPKVYTTPSASVAMLWRQPQATETIFTSSVPSTCNPDLDLRPILWAGALLQSFRYWSTEHCLQMFHKLWHDLIEAWI